ncbi:GNAT family N-acetyltransferase [Pseudomonas sp. CGJS7]|uniref:GNAT family N-acetyltransferase n=1 Tax=Pseudomonas sp. CGJS7 TaxID=3109348 RepID=UPI00300876AF
MNLPPSAASPPPRGDGFVLRPWRAGDIDSLLAHADDEQVSRGLSDRFPYPYTRADGEAFLAGLVIDFSAPLFAIEVDGRACGSISAQPGRYERAHSAELGYWLGRSLWGSGLMTRVVAAFVPWAMRELSLYRLYATVYDHNPASARVLAKNGFIEEGVQQCAVVKRGQVHDLRVFAKVRRSLNNAT